MPKPKFVAALSGGLDSTTLCGYLGHLGCEVLAVSVDYGQRHGRELESARAVAEYLGIELRLVRMLGWELPNSALTDPGVVVPHGYYTDATMRDTVVPARNALLLSVLAGIAGAINADGIAIGVHAGDHAIYPDCRTPFVHAMGAALGLALDRRALLATGRERLASLIRQGTKHFIVAAPFLLDTKTDIVATAAALDLDLGPTWTCYEGGKVHCGKCGACQERQEAFRDAGYRDPTFYAV